MIKYLPACILVTVIAVASGCYRLPEDFSYNLTRIADTNETMINHPEFKKMTIEQQHKELLEIVIKDNKDFRNAAKTVESGK
jgi:hypothetical protein